MLGVFLGESIPVGPSRSYTFALENGFNPPSQLQVRLLVNTPGDMHNPLNLTLVQGEMLFLTVARNRGQI